MGDVFNPERVVAATCPRSDTVAAPATTLSGLETLLRTFPRVARSSQPWAGGHNPFRIEVACNETGAGSGGGVSPHFFRQHKPEKSAVLTPPPKKNAGLTPTPWPSLTGYPVRLTYQV